MHWPYVVAWAAQVDVEWSAKRRSGVVAVCEVAGFILKSRVRQ